jgi:leucyl-tRNA synthetase
MSKSGGNAVSPDAIIESHGTDSLRLYLMFLGPLEAMKPWNPRGNRGAISQMMIFANALQKAESVRPATVRTFLQLLAPFAPHISEELWSRLGGASPIQDAPWPEFDPRLIETSEQTLVFQVNGRHRGDRQVPPGLAEELAVKLACSHPKVAPFLEGKTVRKVIYIPGKILNLVVS